MTPETAHGASWKQPWTLLDRACGVMPGLLQSLAWSGRVAVLRVSAVLRARQGLDRLRTAAEIVWYRHARRGRVTGLRSEFRAGETWYAIEGESAARMIAASQNHVPAARCLADIYIRTAHEDPCWCTLDDRGRLDALLFYLEDYRRDVFILRYPPHAA